MRGSNNPSTPHWRSVRLITEHFVLDTHLPVQTHPPLPLLCLPETTLSFRTAQPDRPLLSLPHCVISRDQIIEIQERLHPQIETRPPRTRRQSPFERQQEPSHEDETTSLPQNLTARDFQMKPIRLVTDALILDAKLAVYQGWAARSPMEWIRRDTRALISLVSIRLQPRNRTTPQDRDVSLRLEGCDLPRWTIRKVSSCPEPTPTKDDHHAHSHA